MKQENKEVLQAMAFGLVMGLGLATVYILRTGGF
jgi:hypothetical protein